MGSDPNPAGDVLLAAVDMGYGHLRAASALSSQLGVPVSQVDRPPFATAHEARLWNLLRTAYTGLSRASQGRWGGRTLRWVLETLTEIPRLYPYRDLSAPSLAVKLATGLIRAGLGKEVVRVVREKDATLLTTFFAPALAAAHAGLRRVVCVVTDSDIARVWVPADPAGHPILYCAPSERAVRRLQAYGVPPHRVHLTGFPLPPELVNEGQEEQVAEAMARRLVRLDPAGTFRRQFRAELQGALPQLAEVSSPEPPRLTFAVGGAGAQAFMVRQFLPSLAPLLREGRLRLALVAGVNERVFRRFQQWVAEAHLDHLPPAVLQVLWEPSVEAYLASFHRLLADTDILWTKPSELTFFAALGIALVFAPPVGVHEVLNRRWALERGAGLKQEHPSAAGQWLADWLADGTLAGAAWNGFRRLPRRGGRRIAELVARLHADPQGLL